MFEHNEIIIAQSKVHFYELLQRSIPVQNKNIPLTSCNWIDACVMRTKDWAKDSDNWNSWFIRLKALYKPVFVTAEIPKVYKKRVKVILCVVLFKFINVFTNLVENSELRLLWLHVYSGDRVPLY